MSGMSGLELQEVLFAQDNYTPIAFLTGSADVPMAVEALKAGAVDFIEKPFEPEAVLQSVKRAMELDLRNRHERLQRSQIEQRFTLLTPREHEVMKWIVQGKSNKAIARILDISVRTVEAHRKKIIEKTQATSLAVLVEMFLTTQPEPVPSTYFYLSSERIHTNFILPHILYSQLIGQCIASRLIRQIADLDWRYTSANDY